MGIDVVPDSPRSEAPKATVEARRDCILISGKTYDITTFSSKHPGGTWISKFAGQDVTCLFESFHPPGVATKYLKALEVTDPERQVTPAPELHRKLTASYLEFASKLDAAGYFRTPLWFILVSVLVPLAVLITAGASVEAGFSLPVNVALFTLAFGLIGWCMHHGGHIALTGNSSIDHKLQAFLFDFSGGLYSRWWRLRHNKHHAASNDPELDPDLETPPALLWHKELLQTRKFKVWANKPFVKRLLAVQSWAFFVYLFFYLHVLFFGARRSAARDVQDRRHRSFTWGTWLHLLNLLLIFTLTEHKLQWVMAWTLGQCFTGFYTGWIFALNHYAMPLADKQLHWTQNVLRTTLNVGFTIGGPFNPVSRVLDFATGYLGYQVEHHLFPRMAACHYPHVHDMVKAWARENELPAFIELSAPAAHMRMQAHMVTRL